MLKCHCHQYTEGNVRNIGIAFSFTFGTLPELHPAWSMCRGLLRNTAYGLEIGVPLASHTLNFTGMVLPALRW